MSACEPGPATTLAAVRAVTPRRGGLEPRKRAAFGQARPRLGLKIGEGIGVWIDAGREIDPGLGRLGREPPGDFERAAVIGERSDRPRSSSIPTVMPFSLTLPLALAALIVEALIGYPAPLYRAIGHPVTWMGRWLAWLEAILNRARARASPRDGRRASSRFASISRRSRLSPGRRPASASRPARSALPRLPFSPRACRRSAASLST